MTETNGLKDAIACDTRISAIENDRLSYAGYDIAELMENNASLRKSSIFCGTCICQLRLN